MSKISIILPTFNRASFLSNSIESVLAQDFLDWELIVIDDGSTDNTSEVIDFYSKNDSRIKYFFQKNGGPGLARNLGLLKSQGEFITFLDSDDLFLPKRLSKMFHFLNEKEIDFCSSAIFLEKDKKRFKVILKENNNQDLAFYLRRIGQTFSGLNVFLRKSLLEKVGFFDENMRHWEDVDFIIKLFEKGRFGYLNEPLFVYKIHKGNLSASQSLGDYVIFYKKNYDLYNKYNLGFYLNRNLALFYLKNKNKRKSRELLFTSLQQRSSVMEKIKIFLILIFSYLPIYLFKK